MLAEFHAAFFQAAISAGLRALCAVLYVQYRKPYLSWWALAWGLYLLRIGAIVGFIRSNDSTWLFVHQVLTGWTGLALLWAALAFSHQPRLRIVHVAVAMFPLAWSYVAIYELDHFLWAAGPAVAFLSLATLWTGWLFFRYRRRVDSPGAALLAATFLLWGLHHLDYPLLRARGAWNPWGYYLDSVFLLVTGIGVLMLVMDELRRGLRALSVLSGDLQRANRTGDSATELLERPFALGGVRGSALFFVRDADGEFVSGLGACAAWPTTRGPQRIRALIHGAVDRRRPAVARRWRDDDGRTDLDGAYAAVLPIFRANEAIGALVIVGDSHDPFTALGDEFLLALGQQVGAVLERADLYDRLAARTEALERLAVRAVQQQEAERRAISLELHDETAQLFSAVKLQLGVLRESVDTSFAPRFDRLVALVDAGIGSIRSVTANLRPPLLDDLGIVPALRALVTEFSERSGLHVDLEVSPASVPPLNDQAELALYRALQEALSNVARHAAATRVTVTLQVRGPDGGGTHSSVIELSVRDDGRGLSESPTGPGRRESMGLVGMRERVGALSGTIQLVQERNQGVDLRIRLPLDQASRQ